MKSRTCPYCHYRYSKIKHISQHVFKIVASKWNCMNCNQKITFDNTRRFYVALFVGLSSFIISGLISILRERMIINFWLWSAIVLFTLLVGLFLCTFDKFTKVEKQE